MSEIYGIGIDVIETERFSRILKRHPRFPARICTEAEIAYCRERKDFESCLAARFAAKEAVLKSLGTGLNGFSWHMLEIVNSQGRPEVRLSGKLLEHSVRLSISKVVLSISSARNYCLAVAVALLAD